MASDLKFHTFDEVAQHNKTKDCWLIINGKVRSLLFISFSCFFFFILLLLIILLLPIVLCSLLTGVLFTLVLDFFFL